MLISNKICHNLFLVKQKFALCFRHRAFFFAFFLFFFVKIFFLLKICSFVCGVEMVQLSLKT